MPRTSARDLSGIVLNGRYQLERRIGAGGFAAVYHAVDTNLGRPVAVKVLHAERVGDEERARFVNEAKILGQIRDRQRYFVPVHEYGVAEGHLFFVMELLHGRTLRQELKRLRESAGKARPISWPRAFQLAAAICDALAVAHAHGIVHRDLKPENIFLEQDESGERVRLLDLGIAKIVQDGPAASPASSMIQGVELALTRSGYVMGSLPYMSPEQATQTKLCDARTDLYSLGVVLYEMLTATLPILVASPLQLMDVGPVDPPNRRLPGLRLPEGLERLVLQALARDRERRFPSAAALAKQIRAELASLKARPEPVEAAPLPESPPEPSPASGWFRVFPPREPTPTDLEVTAVRPARSPPKPAAPPPSRPTAPIRLLQPAPVAQRPAQEIAETDPAAPRRSARDLLLRAQPWFLLATSTTVTLMIALMFARSQAASPPTSAPTLPPRAEPVQSGTSPPPVVPTPPPTPPPPPPSPPEPGAPPKPPARKTMRDAAASAAPAVLRECKLGRFAPLSRAAYIVRFTVQPTTGAIKSVEPVPPVPELADPTCVTNLLRARVRFTGVSPLEATYVHRYNVQR